MVPDGKVILAVPGKAMLFSNLTPVIALLATSDVAIVPSAIFAEVTALFEIKVAPCVPVTSPDKFPEKDAAVVAVAAFPPILKPEAVPVILVPTNVEGVPKLGVVNVGEVDNTTLPVPVDVVVPVPPLATPSVPEKPVAVTPVKPEPLPEKFVAVIVPALKLPVASLKTIVLGVFVAVAVVAELATFPAVLIVANLASEIAAVELISASEIVPSAIFAEVTALFEIVVAFEFADAVTSPVNAALSKLVPFKAVDVEPV